MRPSFSLDFACSSCIGLLRLPVAHPDPRRTAAAPCGLHRTLPGIHSSSPPVPIPAGHPRLFVACPGLCRSVRQPFTEPIIMPFSKYFEKNGYISTSGTLEITMVEYFSRSASFAVSAIFSILATRFGLIWF